MEPTIEWRSRVRLVDEVAQELRERIYASVYEPGAPLREAFRILEREWLLDRAPGHGSRMVSPDLDELLGAYELLEVLDGLAARPGAGSADGDRRHALNEFITRQQAAVDPWLPAPSTLANVEFHTAVYERPTTSTSPPSCRSYG